MVAVLIGYSHNRAIHDQLLRNYIEFRASEGLQKQWLGGQGDDHMEGQHADQTVHSECLLHKVHNVIQFEHYADFAPSH